MTEDNDAPLAGAAGPYCDCGYQCQGETLEDRVRDAQQHAWDVHGIVVSVEQVLEQ
jgi:predicted small metal-binding protein